MWKQWLAASLAVMLGVGIAWIVVQRYTPEPIAAAVPAPLPAGGDFTLQSDSGPVGLADFRGKVVVLYFGYTACPDICPTSMATLKAALEQLTPEEVQHIQGIFISVDPERDKLEQVQRYVHHFHPAIVGVSGSLDELQTIARQYGAFFHKVEMAGSSMGYTIDHSATLYVIDRQGRLRDRIQHAVPPSELAEAIRRVL